LLLVCGFIIVVYWTVQKGKVLEIKSDDLPLKAILDASLSINLKNPLAILLSQVIAIILVARVFGSIFKKIRQPAVIGEVMSGIFLGSSFLGSYFPSFSDFIFPKTSLENLHLISQVGLILFMFIIGMELDLKTLKKNIGNAVIISHASIIIPFSLGMILAYFLYSEFAPQNVNFLSFSLFMGIAMSITAFPVLARILQERGLMSTHFGIIALACAAIDDITAWCILAVVIAIVKANSFTSGMLTITMAMGYIIVMLKVIKPLVKNFWENRTIEKKMNFDRITILFVILLLSSYLTEIIGIHALFGAFLAGVIMPSKSGFRQELIEKIEHVSLGLFLPLFFAYSGLRTQLGLLNNLHLWTVFGLILLIAVLGKFGGSMFTAKLVGQSWKDSLSIGALMNTRGLMELIVLNIGYDLGILTQTFFSIMILMAVATTLMTGPCLDIIDQYSKTKKRSKLNSTCNP
jgi:Kef-type K+ transport system membrane component KefB